jgi:hypothetical protein
MSEGPEQHRQRLWGEWAELLLSILIHGFAAMVAIGAIVGAIVDYDRHFPNPRFHLSPKYAFVVIGVASVALVYIAWRAIAAFRSLRR